MLERTLVRSPSAPIDSAVVDNWCSVFGEQWAERSKKIIPTLMYPTFLRPPAPPLPGQSFATGLGLHDELKLFLNFPVAIATGYALELIGSAFLGDQLNSQERIVELGPERATKFGIGREWVIEVASTRTNGEPVGVERFQMLGYRPGESGAAPPRTQSEFGAVSWIEELRIDRDYMLRSAAVSHVWAPAHHHRDAARAAGLADIILDTSSQVAMFARLAQNRRPRKRIASVQLVMKRPIFPAANLAIQGYEEADVTTISAFVEGRETSRVVVTFST